ncbi:hypothetical protein OROGR_027352 [Orobanche gracilis]
MGKSNDEFAIQKQREEVMAAKTLAHDLDFAFNLQMQEAIAASRAPHTSVQESTAGDFDAVTGDGDEIDFTDLILEDLDRLHQERQDRELCEQEMKEVKVDLDRRIHDKNFAKQIMNIPEKRWIKQGGHFQKPYTLGDSSIGSESFRLYCKGLVSEEMIRDMRKLIGGVGVTICDSEDNRIWEVKKVLEAEESTSPEIAELVALIHGLNWALDFDLGSVTFFCGDSKVFKYVTGRVEPNQSTVATLVKEVARLQTRFSFCQASLVRKNITFVLKLARHAIASQIKWCEGNIYMESCAICYEVVPVDKMFEVDGCFHRLCVVCMKKHLEVRLLDGTTASCPSPGCKSEIQIETCAQILDPKLVEVMIQRRRESMINVSDKVYCPDPKCSELMVKHKLLKYTKPLFVGAEQLGARKCMKCGMFFCINCNVEWHYEMTCDEFRKSKSYQKSEQKMLESMAERKGWRKCRECSTLVELAEGCYHIICRKKDTKFLNADMSSVTPVGLNGKGRKQHVTARSGI